MSLLFLNSLISLIFLYFLVFFVFVSIVLLTFVFQKMKADCLQKFEQIRKNRDELQEKVKNLHVEV